MHKIVAICLFVILLGSCSRTDGSTGTSTETTPQASPVASTDIDGKFDVGGHSLYLKCYGTKSPTIVYMHGSITHRSVDPHANGERFLIALGNERRVCVYDRRNLAHSDTVDAPQRPKDAITDMHKLLAAADVKPPYVLLGASFGGILSYLYANTYPDEVVAMVLLDSMFPDELTLDHLFEPAERIEAFDAEDENNSLERISHFKALKASQPYIGKEPAIPVTYLSSIPEGYDVDPSGPPEYNKKILGLQKAYVQRFSPGRYLRVNAPHFMEPAIPDTITQELQRVIGEAGY